MGVPIIVRIIVYPIEIFIPQAIHLHKCIITFTCDSLKIFFECVFTWNKEKITKFTFTLDKDNRYSYLATHQL